MYSLTLHEARLNTYDKLVDVITDISSRLTKQDIRGHGLEVSTPVRCVTP